MLPKPEFFMKMLPELNDPRVALVLSPQSFHNYNPKSDIFNHSNFTYWEYILPGQPASSCETKLPVGMDPARASCRTQRGSCRQSTSAAPACSVLGVCCARTGPPAAPLWCLNGATYHQVTDLILRWPMWLRAGRETLQGSQALPS